MISLKMVKGAEMAEGVVTEQRLPEPLQRFVIGRDPGAHWPIPDRTLALSARHCEVVATPAGVVLRDLSTNGTFVNGAVARLAGEHRLQDGDRIELGPYTIVVQGGLPRAAAVPPRAVPPCAAPVAAPAPLPAATPRSPSVESTAPLRGGDPAAMLASVAPAGEGLTEILRAALPAEDASVEVTKIRLAPKGAGAGAPATRPAGSTPMPAVGAPGPAAPAPAIAPIPSPRPVDPVPVPAAAAPSAGAAATPAEALLAPLALGLGLPADALAGRDPAQAATQIGALARAAVTVLRQLLEQQSRERRQMGSRAPALQAVRDVNPLRLAATPEAALLALTAPGTDSTAPLQRAAAELARHPQRLLAAFNAATQRLGEEIAPAALQAALPAPSAAETPAQQQARHAQLWALYTQVWQGMGLAPGQTWPQGFVEAAGLHLAAAYDAQGAAEQP
jgi:type VI secretion system FHA domain protein